MTALATVGAARLWLPLAGVLLAFGLTYSALCLDKVINDVAISMALVLAYLLFFEVAR